MTEQISALIDGEMDHEKVDKQIYRMLTDRTAMQAYRDYQHIGDVLRGEPYHGSLSLGSKIMAKIEEEPTILSPNAIQKNQAPEPAIRVEKTQYTNNAWSMAASILAVVAVGLFTWQNVPQNQDHFASIIPTHAVKPAPQRIMAANNEMVASIDNIPAYYFEAHRVSAPSVGSHYIQSVNFAE